MNPVHAVWAASAVGAVLFYFGGYLTSKRGEGASSEPLGPPVDPEAEARLQQSERARTAVAEELKASEAQLKASKSQLQASVSQLQSAKAEVKDLQSKQSAWAQAAPAAEPAPAGASKKEKKDLAAANRKLNAAKAQAETFKRELSATKSQVDTLKAELATAQSSSVAVVPAPIVAEDPAGASTSEIQLRAQLAEAQRDLNETKAATERELKQARAEVEASKRAIEPEHEVVGKLAEAAQSVHEMTAELAKMGRANQKQAAELQRSNAIVSKLTKQVDGHGASGAGDLQSQVVELDQKLSMSGKHIVKQTDEIERLRGRLRAVSATTNAKDGADHQLAQVRLKEKENVDLTVKLKTAETSGRKAANSLRAAERKIKSLEASVRRGSEGDEKETTQDYGTLMEQVKATASNRGEDLQESLRRMVSSHDLATAAISDQMGLPVAGIGDGAERLAAAGIMMVDEGRKAARLCSLDKIRRVSIEDERGFMFSVCPGGEGATAIAFSSLVDGTSPSLDASDALLDHAVNTLL